jgi:hypothetical protein
LPDDEFLALFDEEPLPEELLVLPPLLLLPPLLDVFEFEATLEPDLDVDGWLFGPFMR